MMSRSALGDQEVFALPCSDFGGIAVAEKHVIARFFSGVTHVIRKHGGDPDLVIEDFGIDPQAFKEPERQVSCARAMPLMEECSFKLDSPILGLELAVCQSSDSFGYLSALCSTASDLRRALDAFTAYAPLTISPEGLFEVLESKDHLELRWDCASDLRRLLQGNLHGAYMITRLLHDIGGENCKPVCVNLPQAPPAKFLNELSPIISNAKSVFRRSTMEASCFPRSSRTARWRSRTGSPTARSNGPWPLSSTAWKVTCSRG